MTDFELDPRLERDCVCLFDMPLCRVLLSKDANYPWLILVPRIAGLRELIDLSAPQQQQFLQESNLLSEFLLAQFRPDKLNVAALGNVVEQLHVHHVARFVKDPAWPAPIWNAVPAVPYADQQIDTIKQAFTQFYKDRKSS